MPAIYLYADSLSITRVSGVSPTLRAVRSRFASFTIITRVSGGTLGAARFGLGSANLCVRSIAPCIGLQTYVSFSFPVGQLFRNAKRCSGSRFVKGQLLPLAVLFPYSRPYVN